MGSQVWDAGSEVNDETPANTAFFGQAAPDTGVDEGGNVALHGGFNAPGGGGILDDAMFSGADFTAGGYQVMRITITELALKPTEVTVTVENLAPASGTFLTPVWVGIHDGTFDVFNQGDPASAELEWLAEDGNTGPLDTLFGGSSAGDWQATIASGGAIPPFAPGEMNSTTILIEGSLPTSRYLSYASMAIPSNDAFVGNGDPKAFQISDHNGDFIGGQMIVMGSQVWAAGTEVNDEAPANTAFFGQATPNTGVDENGTVELHGGFNAAGGGGILDDAMFANADFTVPSYEVLRITVSGLLVPVELSEFLVE